MQFAFPANGGKHLYSGEPEISYYSDLSSDDESSTPGAYSTTDLSSDDGSISSSSVKSCRSSSSSIDSDGNHDDDDDEQDHANEEDMDEADDEFMLLPASYDSVPLDAMKLLEAELDGMLKALGFPQHSSME
jgi:hypothetical protein